MTHPTDDELVKRLLVRIPDPARAYKSDATIARNPDGEAAAARIAELEAMLRACKSDDQPKPPANRAEAAARLLDWFPAYPCHPSWDALIEKAEEGADEDDCVRAWLKSLAALEPTLDHSDWNAAIEAAASLIRRVADGYEAGGDAAIAAGLRLTEGNVRTIKKGSPK